MKHKFSSLLLGFMCFSGTIVKSQDTTAKILKDTDHEKMVWFKEAKLGIFIHWGLYAVDGISESWSFYNEYLSHEDYLKQLSGFTAANFKPKEWAKLIKDSGAKYSVITSKHHDGFALWNTNYGHLNAVSHAAAKKDVL
ncbi:alpha-L-fucosidase, partial [Flavobacteriaceae bacterium]|nr:alpha-L-fucosidase [Flavobacteriaceae bacterium]